jgi:EmrB/QacA subfamily drug resistance transporter
MNEAAAAGDERAWLPEFISVQIPSWSARPELSGRRRVGVLAVCCSAVFMVGLDNASVNVAVPSIGRQLHASVAGQQWTIAAYTITLASLMLLSGSLGDRIGRRAVFQAGLATFALGSWLCSLAPSLGWLVAFRVLQGAGGSMLNPVAMSIIASTFPERAVRARAIGVWGAVLGLGIALGPVLGGELVNWAGWRGIFWVNIPASLAAIVLTAMLVPESKTPQARRLDPAGQILVIVMLAALTYAIIEGPVAGWRSTRICGLFLLAAATLVTLAGYEWHHAEPLINPRFFRSAPFTGAVLIAICSYAALGGFLFLSSLYQQDVRGLSALDSGLRLLPAGLGLAACAPAGGWIVARHGTRIPLIIAGTALTLSSAALSRLTGTSPVSDDAISYAIFGIGCGMLNTAITSTAVSGMPSAQAGVASGISSASRQVGLSLGVAITGSVLSSGPHTPAGPGLTAASHTAWWLLTVCGYIVLILGTVTTTQRTPTLGKPDSGAMRSPRKRRTSQPGVRGSDVRDEARLGSA